jgi:hypothetical protein
MMRMRRGIPWLLAMNVVSRGMNAGLVDSSGGQRRGVQYAERPQAQQGIYTPVSDMTSRVVATE